MSNMKARELYMDVSEQVADFVADHAEDARRAAQLDTLHAVGDRIGEGAPQDGRMLEVLLEMCRDKAAGRILQRGGHEGLTVITEEVYKYIKRWYEQLYQQIVNTEWGALAAAVRECAEPLAAMGFKVFVFHGEWIPGVPEWYAPIIVEFPWAGVEDDHPSMHLHYDRPHTAPPPMRIPALPPNAKCEVFPANADAPWRLVISKNKWPSNWNAFERTMPFSTWDYTQAANPDVHVRASWSDMSGQDVA